MHLLVIIAITAGAGAIVAAIAGRKPEQKPVPVRVRTQRPRG